MTRPSFASVLVVLATSCSSSSRARTAAEQGAAEPAGPVSTQRGIAAGDVDRSVDPCREFDDYANGAWRAGNPIPAGKARWNRRGAAREAHRREVREVIQAVAARPGPRAGSPEQLVGDLYASCLDEPAVEAAGIGPIAPLLAAIDGAKTRSEIQRVMRRLLDLGIAAPFGETGAFDDHEPKSFLLVLIAGGLGLPDRDAYLAAGTPAAERRDQYERHVARVLALSGIPEPAAVTAATGILALETRFARASLDPKTAADPAATTHKTTFAELEAMAPHVEWDAYFAEAAIPREPVNVAEPRFLRQVDEELARTPIATWKAYLRWRLLGAASPWLSTTFAGAARALAGATEPEPRAERCADATAELLGEPVGKLYADKHFSPAAKAKARAIANDLIAAVKEHVATLTWLAPSTRATAIDKLASMNIQLGYPDTWKDVSKLQLRRDALWANVAQVRRFQVGDVRREVGRPTDRGRWQLPPWSPSAYIDLQLNQAVLPAGFLQPPYFDVDATDAMNYGALGAGLAHDITHAFDATGARIDASGRARPWWTDADRAAVQQRTQCLIEQYDGYAIEPGVRHQGKLVLDEALGDQAGLQLAYLALQRSIATHPVPTVDGFTPDQQFFLAWAQVRGEAVRIEAQRQIVKTDPHPVPKFRVLGPLSNLPEFAHAFSCEPGSPMVRPPEQRCTAWSP